MLFCLSFTQAERFLQTLITRLQVVVVTNFILTLMRNVIVNVFQVRCSDLVGNDLSRPLIDVRQMAASFNVQELCDEPLEES